MIEYIRHEYGVKDLVIVSPDAGGAKRCDTIENRDCEMKNDTDSYQSRHNRRSFAS